MEKTNFRYLQPQDISDKVDFASVDVSFISLSKILLPARRLLSSGGEMVCLIKPQFEAGKEKVGKKGVVREKSVHYEVIEKIITLADILGFHVLHLDFSPIKGPEGNIEYLIHLKKEDKLDEEFLEATEAMIEEKLAKQIEDKTGKGCSQDSESIIAESVEAAHGTLQ